MALIASRRAASNADKQVKLKPLSSMERVRLAYGGPVVHVRCKAAGRRRPRPALQALRAQADADALLTSQSCGSLPAEKRHDSSTSKTTSSQTMVDHCHKKHLKQQQQQQQQQQHLAAPTDDTSSLSSQQSYTNSSVHTRRRKRRDLAIRRSDIYGIALQPPRRYSWLLSPVRGARAVNVAPLDNENIAASNISCSTPTSHVVRTKAVRVKARSAKQSDGVALTRVVSSDGTADQQPSIMQHEQHTVVAAGTTPVAAAVGIKKSAQKSSQDKRGKNEQHVLNTSANTVSNEAADCEVNTPNDDVVSTESMSVLQDSVVTAAIETVAGTYTGAAADVDTYSDADETCETDDQSESDIVQTSDTVLVVPSVESEAVNHETVQTLSAENSADVEQVQRAIADNNDVLPQSTNWWDNVAAKACSPKAQSISVDKTTDSAITTVSTTEENWWNVIANTTVLAQTVVSSSTQQSGDQQQQQQSNWWDSVAAAVTATTGGRSNSISDRWSVSSDIGSVQSNWLGGAASSSMRTTVATASEVPYAIATTFPKVMLTKRQTDSRAIASDVVTTAASAVAA
eukprot:14382-Heterococcus_DN1.PRE.11